MPSREEGPGAPRLVRARSPAWENRAHERLRAAEPPRAGTLARRRGDGHVPGRARRPSRCVLRGVERSRSLVRRGGSPSRSSTPARGVVWTNTFGANRFKLDRHGMADRVDELARAGVRLARRGGVLVAGSVGPLGVRLAPYGRVGTEHARDAYAEQISALVEAGADLVAIETQTDLNEMEAALAASRAVAPGVAVLVTATFTQDDRTMLGSTPQTVAARLAELGADAIGVNCGQGPAQVLRVVRAMRPSAAGVPLVARPNAGGPQSVGGRFLYPATPQYMAGAAAALLVEGVRLLGGCCGTGPAHIEEIASALESPRAAGVFEPPREVALADRPRGISDGPASRLGAKLADGRPIVAVEIEPPRGFSAGRMVAAAETLVQAGADVIDVADSPMAKMRMSPWAACRLIQESTGAETVLHFPTRGRNLLRLQGDLLGVHALGIRNLFVCLGDPVTVGRLPARDRQRRRHPTGLMSLDHRRVQPRNRQGRLIHRRAHELPRWMRPEPRARGSRRGGEAPQAEDRRGSDVRAEPAPLFGGAAAGLPSRVRAPIRIDSGSRSSPGSFRS